MVDHLVENVTDEPVTRLLRAGTADLSHAFPEKLVVQLLEVRPPVGVSLIQSLEGRPPP